MGAHPGMSGARPRRRARAPVACAAAGDRESRGRAAGRRCGAPAAGLEEQAILDLIERWGWVDRSHRKLAHRGSYTGVVFVSPSTVLRVALKNRVALPGEPVRARPVLPAMPAGSVGEESHLDMGRLAFHARQAGRVRDRRRRHPLLDRLPAHHRADHTQVQLLFARALEDQGLLGPDGRPLRDEQDGPRSWSPGLTTGRR